MSAPKIVALIPARAGSKRVVGKNKRLLAGHPLIAYTIAAAKQSGIFGGIAVSTDDEEIAALAWAMGVQVIQRYPEHATDTSPDIEWVKAAMERSLKYDCGHIDEIYSAFSILRPTSPFRSAETIRKAWAAFQANPYADSLRAITTVAQHPLKMWEFVQPDRGPTMMRPYLSWANELIAGAPAHSSPTQQLDKVYVQTAGLEIAWIRCVTEWGSISGRQVMPWYLDFPESIDLNEERDFLFAEFLVERGLAALPAVE